MTAPASRPLVSVLVANHDHGPFVVEAVQSALDQTYRPIEVVVVDDASTDDSVERLHAHFGDRIHLIAETTNRGQVRALETALRASTGSIICLLDADDRWQPDKVARIVESFSSRPELTQISHGLRTITHDGRPLTGRPNRIGKLRMRRRMPLSRGDVRSALFRWNQYGYGITSGLSYPRWVLEAATPAPDDFATRSHYFDTWTTVAAAFLGPVGAIDDALMDYRIHDSNAAGGSDDFGRFIRTWQTTGAMIDHWAERTGDPRRADPERNDNRLVLFRHLAGDDVAVSQRLRVLARTPVELAVIGAQPLDGAIRTAERIVMASSRRQGAAIKRLGLSRWLRQRTT